MFGFKLAQVFAAMPLTRPTLTLVIALVAMLSDDFILDSFLYRFSLRSGGEFTVKLASVGVKREIHSLRLHHVGMFLGARQRAISLHRCE